MGDEDQRLSQTFPSTLSISDLMVESKRETNKQHKYLYIDLCLIDICIHPAVDMVYAWVLGFD